MRSAAGRLRLTGLGMAALQKLLPGGAPTKTLGSKSCHMLLGRCHFAQLLFVSHRQE